MLLRAHPVMGWHPLQGQSMARDPLLQYAFWKRTCKSLLNYDVSVQTWFSTRILLCFLSLNRFNLSSLKQKQNLLLILIRSGKSCGHISPQVREYGFRNPENVACENRNVTKFCLWNLKFRALESGIQLKKSHQRFDFGIQFQLTKNPEFTAWNPESKTVFDSLIWAIHFKAMPKVSCQFWLTSARVTLGTRGFSRVRREFSVLAEGRSPEKDFSRRSL